MIKIWSEIFSHYQNYLKMSAEKNISNSKSSRNNYGFDVMYKFGGSGQKTVSVGYSVNDYEQETTYKTSYSEKVFKTNLRLRF